MNDGYERVTTDSARSIEDTFILLGDANIAAHSARFFKSGIGEYGEGDKFLGIRVPVIREFAKKHGRISLKTADALLKSDWHEVRLLALIMLADTYQRSSPSEQKVIFDFYLSHTSRINNWDLVDCSAHIIVGRYLLAHPRDVLYRLVGSDSLWERRIAMLATFTFIRHNQFEDTLLLTERLLTDKEDLIHKACGWMLREVGKRDAEKLKQFLDAQARNMPRTMLRYAIEKFSPEERKHYLS